MSKNNNNNKEMSNKEAWNMPCVLVVVKGEKELLITPDGVVELTS